MAVLNNSVRTINWTCPYCGRAQAATPAQQFYATQPFDLSENKYGKTGIIVAARSCANEACGEITISAQFANVWKNQYGVIQTGEIHERFRLRPNSLAKTQPDYIPIALREDYNEACLIKDLSPKASATLARRCLQGMIRKFCGIGKKRLIDEIIELRRLSNDGQAPKGVTDESVDAIDHVREIGNIGAHMEKDIGVIVPIDPGEAQVLIELVELLFLITPVPPHTGRGSDARH